MEKKSIKGTKTEHNLLASFAGESQARSRYTLFAKKAREEGYEQIARIFLITAEQELSHAELFFSRLEGGVVQIAAGYPAGQTFAKLPPENARNGVTSTLRLQGQPKKKVFPTLQPCSRWWLKSRFSTSNAIFVCSNA